jgi:hypothetical protein
MRTIRARLQMTAIACAAAALIAFAAMRLHA